MLARGALGTVQVIVSQAGRAERVSSSLVLNSRLFFLLVVVVVVVVVVLGEDSDATTVAFSSVLTRAVLIMTNK